MRSHTVTEAAEVIDTVEEWQRTFTALVGHPMVHASDEYYILAGRDFPEKEAYGDIPMHEDGIGMARTFEAEFNGTSDETIGVQSGFFAWVDAAPAEGYRAPRTCGDESAPLQIRPRANAPIGILTGTLGAAVLEPLVAEHKRDDVRVIPVENEFFGGNVGVSGLLVGADLERVLREEPQGHRYLLPDVCLNRGVFLDGTRPEDLPRSVEIIATDGVALRTALELS
jgi:NifB/MoaA-like Fe-S oxidoreductase